MASGEKLVSPSLNAFNIASKAFSHVSKAFNHVSRVFSEGLLFNK